MSHAQESLYIDVVVPEVLSLPRAGVPLHISVRVPDAISPPVEGLKHLPGVLPVLPQLDRLVDRVCVHLSDALVLISLNIGILLPRNIIVVKG